MIQVPSSMKPADQAIEAELVRLAKAPILELRKRYRECFERTRRKLSVQTCCAGVLPIGFKKKPMAACLVRPSACSTSL
jgi:hypothetical protein